MTATSPQAFMLSATLHAAVVALLLVLNYAVTQNAKEASKVFELVAGEGDNYMATEAPALGTPGGKQTAKTTPKAPSEQTQNFKKAIQRQITAANRRAEREIAANRAAEEKRRAAEEKAEKLREAENARKMTKEEFDRQNKTKSTASPNTKVAQAKIVPIDAAGISKGVLGGSTANTRGGAGGKALTALEGDLADRYGAFLMQKLREELERSADFDEGLVAEAEFRIMEDGRLVRGRITKTSGSDAFDRAVLKAIAAVKVGPRPKGIAELQVVPFSTKSRDAR